MLTSGRKISIVQRQPVSKISYSCCRTNGHPALCLCGGSNFLLRPSLGRYRLFSVPQGVACSSQTHPSRKSTLCSVSGQVDPCLQNLQCGIHAILAIRRECIQEWSTYTHCDCKVRWTSNSKKSVMSYLLLHQELLPSGRQLPVSHLHRRIAGTLSWGRLCCAFP